MHRKRTFVIRFDRGDEVISSLSAFCEQHHIKGGMIYGIGAFSKATFYAVVNSEIFKTNQMEINEPMEIVSALGNVSTDENGKPIVHIHSCVEVHASKTVAGHLLKGIISYTGEFFIIETDNIQKAKQGDLHLFKLDKPNGNQPQHI